ncbi:MAG: hypothetical protein KF754_15785 [Planctomycetes bacterium]|nr:hypothetical protein [Planctomycetota bacterium]
MRSIRTGCLLIVACGLLAATLPAANPGDLMPRGTLGYGRIKDVSEGIKRLAGGDWMTLFDRALNTRRQSERRDSDPVVNEIKRFINHAGTLEIALVDVMVRDPNVQMTFVLHLGTGAPAEFSEDLLAWAKREAGREGAAKITATSISAEDVTFTLRKGLCVVTIGGAAQRHVDDALAGDLAESLSQVERFRKWTETAKSDIELWLDMKALRNAIDKLGEDMRMDSEVQQMLDTIEWQKMDTVSLSANLPSKSGGGITASLDMTFSQPVENLGALMRPAGASRLVRVLPAETLGFLSLQLGNDALATWTDIARYVHDTEQRSQPSRLERNLRWARQEVQHIERMLQDLEKGDKDSDKDGTREYSQRAVPKPEVVKPAEDEEGPMEPDDPEPYDPAKYKEELLERLKEAKEQVARYEEQMRAYKVRPFSPDAEGRTSQPSEGEEMYDQVERLLKQMGINRTELAEVIGSELIGGFVALPDPTDRALRDMFEHNWFVALELREGHEAMKAKVIDWLLGKKLPEGADEDEKEEARRRAEQLMFKKVDGGEILRERGAFSSFCVFFGEGLVGIAHNEDIALRVLKAAGGSGRFAPGNVPGGGVGSKMLYIDLGEFLARVEQEEGRWQRRERRFITPKMEVRKLLKNGLRLGITTNESPTRLSFTLATSGESSLRPTLELLASELELERAWRHDEDMLQELGTGVFSWLSGKQEELSKLSADDLAAALAAVTPQKLLTDGFFSPQDGMRSAFDPAMASRFAAMLKAGTDELGGEGGPGEMKESGFEWFGLPKTMDFGAMDGFGWGEIGNIWLVCAAKGNWARGGRPALVLSGANTRVVWLEEAEFKLIRAANAGGRRLAELPENEPEMPAWKAKIRIAEHRWTLMSLSERLRMAVETAVAEGRELQISFDGANEEKPLEKVRALLGISADDWFELENAKALTIEAKGEKFRARIKQGDAWIEIDQDGKITTSWDNE